ncbi:MAG: choice-of-anchor J domain-containing protein [Holophagales bacterium]|nr:MAG: choice-of-anchor J domain-containing protein [Holophagales bacterium]
MNRTAWIPRVSTIVVIAALLALGWGTSASAAPMAAPATKVAATDPLAGFPTTVVWHGRAADRLGQPLAGRNTIEIRYFAGGHELFAERYRNVNVADGRFDLKLGTGKVLKVAGSSVASLRELFSRHPELEMEVRIGSTVQSPRVRMLPAGHSPAGVRALSGATPVDDGKPHSKFFNARGGATGIEAALLRPSGAAGPADPATPEVVTHPFEIDVEGPWLSQPLRDLPGLPAQVGPAPEPKETNRPRHETLYDSEGYQFGTRNEEIVDPLAATSLNPNGAETPAPLNDFPGMDQTQGFYPPDTHGAVGPNHYIQVVNVKFRVFNKNGTPADVEKNTNVLWTAMGGGCASDNDGDAIFLYDKAAGRWLLTQFSVTTTPERVCLAISQTADPLGAYYLYSLTTQRFPDYFKFGVWPDPTYNAYYMTTNSGFANQYDVYALDRANMLTGAAARPAKYFQNFPNLFMPADLDGSALPPSGTGGLMYTILDGTDPYFVPSPGVDTLRLYEFKVDWNTPANSTFTQVASFTPSSAPVPLAAFNWTVCGFFTSNCLSQPGTTVKIDSASWWPMQRLVYRNYGTHESLYGTWTVDVTGTPDLAAPRWFELRRTGGTSGTWTIYQQGTYSPNGDHRWMGSIAADRDGNLALGYSVLNAATTLYPSIRYTVRSAGDPLGTMQAEQTLHVGSGSQTGSAGRWGDYAAMNIDPTDDCTFWFTTEFIETTGNASWKTRIGNFKIPGCGGLAVTPTSQSLCSTAGTASFGVELSGVFAGTTNMSTSTCPAGATCSYTVNPVVFPATSTSLQVGNLASVAAGTYNFDAVATDNANPTITRNVPLSLSVSTASPAAPALTAPANGALNVAVRPTFQWGAVAQAATYRLQVSTSAGFGTLLVDQSGITGTSYTPTSDLPSNSVLYWRVTPSNPCGTGLNSATYTFSTTALPGDCGIGTTPQQVFFENFDGVVTGWTHSGTGDTWASSTTRNHSAPNAYLAVDTTTVSDQRLVSPAIVLPATASGLTLQFWNYQSFEDNPPNCYDGAIIEVTTNGGTTWTQIPNGSLQTDPYNGTISASFSNPMANLSAWCGDPQDWLNSVVDLSAYAGNTVQFRFRIGTDTSAGRAPDGWHIDDVKVQACISGVIFNDGFESGAFAPWNGGAYN